MVNLTVLGATGSIGQSTLDVVRRHPQRFKVVALTAQRSVDQMARLCAEFDPRYAVLTDADRALELQHRLTAIGLDTEVLAGEAAQVEVAALTEVDCVMAAIVGAAGLLPTLAAVRAGKRVLLANKEALVVSGRLFMDEVLRSGATLLPIDSEHNAIYQSLPDAIQTTLGRCDLAGAGVRHILLTGSGGPFRQTPLEQLPQQTPAQACAHPNWSMGRKISVDSATMMNKGLEYVEAKWLFNAGREQLQVVIHPQSVIHSMVQYQDGSVIAQLGQPDMRTPIAHAMAYPERISSGVEPLDFLTVGQLTFDEPDFARYPCLKLAIEACHQGQSATTVLNAANEVCVAAFLDGRIGFTQIAEINERMLQHHPFTEVDELESLLALDRRVRARTQQWIRENGA